MGVGGCSYDLFYAEFPQNFVWKSSTREWVIRQRGFSLGRIFYVPPGSGEIYYLRCLLNVVRSPKSFDDIKTVDDMLYTTFRDACYAHEAVWEKCWTYLSDDILYRQRQLLNHQDLSLTDDEIKNLALVEIENLMPKFGTTLRDYDPMSFPDMISSSTVGNKLIYDELRYNRAALTEEHKNMVVNLTDEQRHVYDMIIDADDSRRGGVFFVYGYGGTGKTFLWKTLSAAIRSKSEIVLNVASSGIASLLLPGGRTAHSLFAIPLHPNENSKCSIKQGSPLAELIVKIDHLG